MCDGRKPGIKWPRLLSQFPQKLGAYVLLGPLGEGGMGAVYLAMSGHREMETLCVVKRLLPALQSQPDHVLRFRREADLARRLVHGNLAHTHNIGEVEGEVFLVQEFVEGHDVSALLDELAGRKQTLPVALAAHIVSEIARGLSYAHAFEKLELVHRDINPPNIRVTYSGEVKLLDFGIASTNLHGDARAEHRGAGKLWHLAPEQVQPGGTVDRRTDIYALGVVLWELLTQRPVGTTRTAQGDVCQPETEGEVLVWISRGQHEAPSVFNPEVPPELDALVTKATHVEPSFRFVDADELRAALAAFIPAGFPAEPQLAGLMQELFSPEAERAQRRALIDQARHLLAVSGPHRRDGRRSTDVRPQPAGAVERRWRGPRILAALSLAGLATLLVWALGGLGHRDRAQPSPGVGAAAVSPTPQPPSSATLSPVVAPPSLPAQAPKASLPVTGAAPAQAAAESPPATGADAKPVRPAGAGKPVDAAPAAAPAPVRSDHLHLARDAFNARDWPRALSHAKLAAAAGGGADAHALVGSTYFKMGRFTEAVSAYTKAATLDPQNTLLRERLELARVRAGEASPQK
jgi:eukaryotic-like serine/threonine-protein kinase